MTDTAHSPGIAPRPTPRFKNLMRPERSVASPMVTPAAPLLNDATQAVSKGIGPLIVTAFLISLFIPIHFFIGDLRLSAYRIILLATIIPAVIAFARSSRGSFLAADYFILGHTLIGGVTLLITGSEIPSFGIFAVEAAGPYFLARAYIRNSADFVRMVRWLFYCITFTIPFAIYENLTTQPIILKVLGSVFSVVRLVPHEQRLGLDRAQVVFDHPILYGVFCSMGFTLALFTCEAGQKVRLRFVRGGLVGLASFLSLSSGALVCVAFQIALVGYDRVLAAMRERWKIFLIGCAVMYVVLEVASNRTVPQILIPYIALNEGTAWTRLIVNASVMEQIAKSPWYGFGLDTDWVRPHWVVTGSIDNFWLALTYRHGIPAVLLLGLAALAVMIGLMKANVANEHENRMRIGLAITIGALCMAITTVHLWNSTYCMFIFLLGAGQWLIDASKNKLGPQINVHSDTLAPEDHRAS